MLNDRGLRTFCLKGENEVMAAISEQRLMDALATLTRVFADGGVPALPGIGEGNTTTEDSTSTLPKLNPETGEVLGEAALAVAFGAFASRGGDSGPIHTLIATLGLMAILAGEEPDPPAEILGIAAEDERVEAEIDRAGEAVDAEFGPDASGSAVTAMLEARILGTAVTLAGCTLPDGVEGQAAVRLRAARCLAKLAAGMIAMNVAGTGAAGVPSPSGQAPGPE
ncbi:MAG TPA: hypothetical protein VIL69_23670 [Roseomonas sp.]|jgi:hypothetical protein